MIIIMRGHKNTSAAELSEPKIKKTIIDLVMNPYYGMGSKK